MQCKIPIFFVGLTSCISLYLYRIITYAQYAKGICIIRSVVVGIAAVLWGCNDDVDDVVDNDDDNKIAEQFVDKFSFSVFCPAPSPFCLFVCVGFCGIFGISGKPTKCIQRFVFNLFT